MVNIVNIIPSKNQHADISIYLKTLLLARLYAPGLFACRGTSCLNFKIFRNIWIDSGTLLTVKLNLRLFYISADVFNIDIHYLTQKTCATLKPIMSTFWYRRQQLCTSAPAVIHENTRLCSLHFRTKKIHAETDLRSASVCEGESFAFWLLHESWSAEVVNQSAFSHSGSVSQVVKSHQRFVWNSDCFTFVWLYPIHLFCSETLEVLADSLMNGMWIINA